MQQFIGFHGVVIGWADDTLKYGPALVIELIRWDGTDLFAAGLPSYRPNGEAEK